VYREYYLFANSINDPESVLSRNKKNNEIKARGRSERELTRLVKRLGADDIISYLSKMKK